MSWLRTGSSSASSVPTVTSSAPAIRHRVSSEGFPAPDSIVARIVFESPARAAVALSERPRASRCARISRATRVVTAVSSALASMV
jgi:hypothetical protein